MTILPAKRNAVTPEDASPQTGIADRPRRSPNLSKPGSRRTRRRSTTPEPADQSLQKRFKGPVERTRRKLGRSRKINRIEVATEANHESSSGSSSVDQIDKVSNDNKKANTEDETGFNSEDEYATPINIINHHISKDWATRDSLFAQCLEKQGYEIKHMNDDGACLFRAIADQIYGDQDFHDVVRASCMDYIAKNKDFFGPYVIEDFDKYIARKRKWNVYGNHLEIQAMSEMYNRTIEVYCYEMKPINIFNGPTINTDEPIRLSYHRMSHYNSICNPNKPSVGVGLGLPGYSTTDLNKRRLVEAIRASDELLIEQTMLEDKLKATDWEATNEALEQAVARESYLQYFRDAEMRTKGLGESNSGISSTSSSSLRGGSTSPSSPIGSGFSSLRSSPRSPTSKVECANSSLSLNLRGISTALKGCSPKVKECPSPRSSTSNLDYISITSSLRPTCRGRSTSPTGSSSKGALRLSPRSATAKTDHANDTEVDFGRKPLPSSQASTEYATRLKLGFEFPDLYNRKYDAKEASSISVGDLLGVDDCEDDIMAQVLLESRNTYIDSLKRNLKKLDSPGPSTSR